MFDIANEMIIQDIGHSLAPHYIYCVPKTKKQIGVRITRKKE
jgi:hypothetical protein